MSPSDLLLSILPLIAVAAWLFIMHQAEQDARRKLGEPRLEIRLYRRSAQILFMGMAIFAVLLPVILVVVAIIERIPAEDVGTQLIRTLWLGSMAYGFRKGNLLLVGSEGLAFAQSGVIPWERVKEVRWDRDIGQRQWGMLLVWEIDKKRTQKQRLFVRREMKEEVERAIDRFGHGSNPAPHAAPFPNEAGA